MTLVLHHHLGEVGGRRPAAGHVVAGQAGVDVHEEGPLSTGDAEAGLDLGPLVEIDGGTDGVEGFLLVGVGELL